MRATAPATSNSPRMRMRITASDLDVHDLLDHHRPRDDHEHADCEQDASGGMGEERFHVIRVEERDHEQQTDGQKRYDPAGESPLSSQAPHQPAERGSLADPLDHAI